MVISAAKAISTILLVVIRGSVELTVEFLLFKQFVAFCFEVVGSSIFSVLF